jgi:phospholipid N-methyltransferase
MQSLNIFIGQSLKNFIKVGAFLPSTPLLARRMVKGIESSVIVELGPGTGVFTKEILKKLPKDGRLIAIENNEIFVRYLKDKIKDKRLEICIGDAINLKDLLNKRGINKVSYIISGLPLGNFNKDLKNKILKEISNSLDDHGTFIQFEYLLAGMRAVKSVFPHISLSYEIWNIPPAFVMRCRKSKK